MPFPYSIFIYFFPLSFLPPALTLSYLSKLSLFHSPPSTPFLFFRLSFFPSPFTLLSYVAKQFNFFRLPSYFFFLFLILSVIPSVFLPRFLSFLSSYFHSSLHLLLSFILRSQTLQHLQSHLFILFFSFSYFVIPPLCCPWSPFFPFCSLLSLLPPFTLFPTPFSSARGLSGQQVS